jgi:transaldolase
MQEVLVQSGREILAIIPGRVSTETDAHDAFDVEALVRGARAFIARYQELGIDRSGS